MGQAGFDLVWVDPQNLAEHGGKILTVALRVPRLATVAESDVKISVEPEADPLLAGGIT